MRLRYGLSAIQHWRMIEVLDSSPVRPSISIDVKNNRVVVEILKRIPLAHAVDGCTHAIGMATYDNREPQAGALVCDEQQPRVSPIREGGGT